MVAVNLLRHVIPTSPLFIEYHASRPEASRYVLVNPWLKGLHSNAIVFFLFQFSALLRIRRIVFRGIIACAAALFRMPAAKEKVIH